MSYYSVKREILPRSGIELFHVKSAHGIRVSSYFDSEDATKKAKELNKKMKQNQTK